jgi:hypothetical protein
MKAAHLVEIVQALNGAGVRYLVVGGLAVNAHGFLRYTNDVDLVIQLESANLLTALRALAGLGYRPKHPVTAEQFADAGLRESWIEGKDMLVFPLWGDQRVETPIDILVREPFDFETEWPKAVRGEVSEGVFAPFVALATLVALKRKAGRPQDLADLSQLRLIWGKDLPGE